MQSIQLAFLGMWELLAILAIVFILFGASKLPALGDGLGKGIRNFKRAFKDSPKEVDGQAKRVDEGKQPEQLPPASHEAPQHEKQNSDVKSDSP